MNVEHLKLIQGVIERVARNSFLLKGWAVTLVAACFVLAVRGADPWLAMIAGLISGVGFWGLDAYYLRQERMYRMLYDDARRGKLNDDLFTLDARPYASSVESWPRTLRSLTVSVFYGSLVFVAIFGLLFFSVRPD